MLEVDERVTLVGYTSDPKQAEHALEFNEDGSIAQAYSGNGAEAQKQLLGDKIVRGISGEAVVILQEPGGWGLEG